MQFLQQITETLQPLRPNHGSSTPGLGAAQFGTSSIAELRRRGK